MTNINLSPTEQLASLARMKADADRNAETWRQYGGQRDQEIIALRRQLADARAQAVEECIREIPTTWLDPLLSGPTKVLPNGAEWGGLDIERLLSALVSRLRALLHPGRGAEGDDVMTTEPAASRERIAKLLYDAHYVQASSLAWPWEKVSMETRETHRAMADAVLADRAQATEPTGCPTPGACSCTGVALTAAQATIARLEQEAHVSAREWEERRDEMVRIHEERTKDLREALHEVVWGGIEFSDTRVGYVTVQIDRATLDRMRALIAARSAREGAGVSDVPRYAGLLAPAERSTRFNDTAGALTWGRQSADLHPDRCTCQSGDVTPHKHYQEPPYRCARCSACAGYAPAERTGPGLTPRGPRGG